MYENQPIPKVDVEHDVFALDSTTISLSLKLFTWAEGKYSRGAVKVHTMLDLRGNIPTYILITDGRYHDSNVLDVMPIQPDAIYVMDKAYVDFAALYNIHNSGAFFITRAKVTLDCSVVDQNFNIDESTGLRGDKTITLNGSKSKKLWGHSENAVNIHIWVAICTYLIVAYVKYTLNSQLSIYEIMQILGISAFDKTPVKELLTDFQDNQNFKEQRDLFDSNF